MELLQVSERVLDFLSGSVQLYTKSYCHMQYVQMCLPLNALHSPWAISERSL